MPVAGSACSRSRVALNAARVALAIQLQPARIFWMLDFTATVYVVWALAEGRSGIADPSRDRRRDDRAAGDRCAAAT